MKKVTFKNRIPYTSHFISNEDCAEVVKSLKSKFITSGDYNKILKNKFQKLFSNKNIVLTSSATASLDIAFRSLNLKKNDIIIMPAINFIAAYNMANNLNLKIFLCDVDPLTGQMTPKLLEECIKKNKIKKIKCLLTMYLGGAPENVEKFYLLKKKYKFFLVEDACHALGSYFTIKNHSFLIGMNKFSDISVFSFHPAKIITSGEGGMLSIKDKKIFYRAQILKEHGIERTKDHWNYNVVSSGFNYRISEINCSLCLSQLKNLKNFSKKRNSLARYYIKKLANFENIIKVPEYSKNIFNSYHLFIIHIDFTRLYKSKDFFLRYMLDKGIVCQQHYIPIYKFKIYKNNKKYFYNSENYIKTCVSLPIFYKLAGRQQDYIIKIIKKFILKHKKE
jgi:dTDP-4-amino-4,6-dideoxygalactose transaminase